MNLIFRNSYGKERIIGNPKNREEVFENIHAFKDECNAKRTDGKTFEIYYIRMWKEENRMKFDFGSHSEFIYAELVEDETWESVDLDIRR